MTSGQKYPPTLWFLSTCCTILSYHILALLILALQLVRLMIVKSSG